MIQIPTRALRAALPATATDNKTNYGIDRIRTDGATIEATDGHIALRIVCGDAPAAKPAYLGASVAKDATRGKDEYVTLADGRLTLGTGASLPCPEPDDLRWPELDRVVPAASDDDLRVTLSAEVLSALTAAIKALHKGTSSREGGTVRLRFRRAAMPPATPDPESMCPTYYADSIRVESTYGGCTLTGAVAPCREGL